jgi:cyclohexyl-isocyanide hydratase
MRNYANTLHIGLLVFPGVQQLDLTGPYEVLASLPGAAMHLAGRALDPVRSATGLELRPTVTYVDCPALDVLCVPGGIGVNALMRDPVTLDFVRRQAKQARYVTSVCTGALVLGAAGLLRGKRATTHWASHDFLERFGAIPVKERVVRDGNLFTGGGVTAGIDFALTLAAELAGRETAEAIQLELEYAPAPPFNAGTPETAPKAVLEMARIDGAANRRERELIIAALTEGRLAEVS